MPKNVVLITTDEQCFDSIAFNGNPHVKTPNLDRLASQSINFRHHTSSTPICTPARATLLTGQYARTHGAWHVGYTLSTGAPTLPKTLSAAGYECGLFGKGHFEPEMSNFQGDVPVPYYGFGHVALSEDNLQGPYVEWIRREHPEALAGVLNDSNEGVRFHPLPPPENGQLTANYISETPDELHQTTWITNQTLGFLDDRKADEAPFMVWCSYVDPHHPWNPVKEFFEMYDPSAMPIPDVPDEYDVEPIGYARIPGMTDAEFQRMRAAYYAMVTHLDHHIGRILDALEANGQLEDTIIMFTSDHGDYNGDHGFIRKNWWMYESILRVPMMVRLPDGSRGGTWYEGPTQHEDVVPTLCELLEINGLPHMQGESFLPVLNGDGESAREYSYYERTRGIQRAFGVRKDDMKLMVYPDSRGYWLNDLASDPTEDVNLFGQPDVAGVQQELQNELLDWLMRAEHYYPPKTYKW